MLDKKLLRSGNDSTCCVDLTSLTTNLVGFTDFEMISLISDARLYHLQYLSLTQCPHLCDDHVPMICGIVCPLT